MTKIGVAFGGYCPLHQGHLDTIMQAKKENDICYVFVCGYKNDRGGDMLPLQKRYRLIKEFLECENIRVMIIDDDKLGLDGSMSPHNWELWLGDAYNKICAADPYCGYDEVTWYVGEERYVNDILNNTPSPFPPFYIKVKLIDRSLNPVSGTLCRANPLKYWDHITLPFRPYYSHNILITGTASEGKTTLVQDIGRYFGIQYSYEKGRDNCVTKTDPEFDMEDFMYNIYEQHKYNKECIHSPANRGIFISDTDNIVTLMYAYWYSQRENFSLNGCDYKVLYSMAQAYERKTKWDKIFLIKPSHKGIVDDGTRYMADSDYAIRKDFYEFLKKTYTKFGYEFEEIDGDYYENYLTVKNYILNYMNGVNSND